MPASRAARLAGNALISVVVPVYNVEKFVRDCLESLMAQDDRHFEVVVIDDGSTDSSVAEVERFAGRIERLEIHSQANTGLGGARNAGLARASGDFVVFVDSDDVVTPNMISRLRRAQEMGEYEIVTAPVHLVSESLQFLQLPDDSPPPDLDPPAMPHELVLGTYHSNVACARLYRRDLLLDSGVRFPERVLHEDLFFTYKALRFAKRIGYAADCAYWWRTRHDSISRTLTPAHVSVLPRLREDTHRFLSGVRATDREFAFAARRNLRLLASFRTKASRSPQATLDVFMDMVRVTTPDIVEDLGRYDLLAAPDEASLVQRVWGIIREAQLRPRSRPLTGADVTDEAPARSSQPLPSRSIDFALFPLRAYHVREARAVIEDLERRGLAAHLIDTDDYRQGGNEVREAASELGMELIPLGDFIERRMALRVAVFWNDWDPLIRVIARECHRAGIVTVGWVEGVNDYHDVDTGRARHAYLRSRHVIVPGEFDRRYFRDTGQTVYVGEVVRIREMWQTHRQYESDLRRRRALINSNFSYGVLVEHRDSWVRDAVEASLAAGLEPVVSRHPFDLGIEYSEYQTRESFLEAVRRCDVTIQRFGSGILEALALGVPVIYFNPHGERIDKFADARGAYVAATTRDELERVLRDDSFLWREKEAKAFLSYHAGLADDGQAGETIAGILARILDDAADPSAALAAGLAELPEIGDVERVTHEGRKIGPFYGASAAEAQQKLPDSAPPALLVDQSRMDITGAPRGAHAYVDEAAVVARLLAERRGPEHVMLDVGAHLGTTASHFQELGWTVYCFEPDPETRKKLTDRYRNAANVTIDPRALGDTPASGVPFYSSEESTGISSLAAFRPSHRQTARVDVTTVGAVAQEHRLERIDFLKIDAEGFDLAVLRGIPWGDLKPDVIECEFEDAKTLQLGHTTGDIADYLRDKGYAVYVSEWHPVTRYGIRHDWRRVMPYTGGLIPEEAWGNLLAFRTDPGLPAIRRVFSEEMKFAPTPAMSSIAQGTKPAGATRDMSSRPFYAPFGDWLKPRSPVLYRALQLARRGAADVWSRRRWTIPPLLLVAALFLVGFLPAVTEERIVLWGAAAFAAALFTTLYAALRIHETVDALRGESAVLRRAQAVTDSRAAQQERVIAGLGQLRTTLLDERRELEVSIGERLNESLEPVKETLMRLEGTFRAEIEGLASASEAGRAALEAEIERLAQTSEARDSEVKRDVERLAAATGASLDGLNASIARLAQATTDLEDASERLARSDGFQGLNRDLGPTQVEVLRTKWASILDLDLAPTALSYLAHRIRTLERNSTGRLAAQIEDAVLRSLVVSAVRRDTLDVLEIGTLFGIGAAMLYDYARDRYEAVRLTVIDPLDGYYGQPRDGHLQIPVSKRVFWRNMAVAQVPVEDVVLIDALSHDDAAIAKARNRQYDVLIIDADHSYEGVKSDFGTFGGMMRHGGYIVFDDYGAPEWPDVKRFVDDEVMGRAEIEFVGAEWRTAVFRVRAEEPREGPPGARR